VIEAETQQMIAELPFEIGARGRAVVLAVDDDWSSKIETATSRWRRRRLV